MVCMTQYSVIRIIHRNVDLKCFFHLPKFLLLSLFLAYIHISLVCVETHLRCGEIYNKNKAKRTGIFLGKPRQFILICLIFCYYSVD